MRATIFIICQYLAPQHTLSRLAGFLADTQIVWLKSSLINLFMRFFPINMEEAAEEDPSLYRSFNAFFCRALKADARKFVLANDSLISPADGEISQIGGIQKNQLIQAKGKFYTVEALLGGNKALASELTDGKYATIYLAPKDYHRVHMPLDGKLRSMTYIPGQLFSVNTVTTENVDKLFARNERVVCVFDTELGPLVMVLVGAMIVGSIVTTWAGQVAPLERKISTINYLDDTEIHLRQGEEMGRFKLGSTVILLLPNSGASWLNALTETSLVRVGEKIGEYQNSSSTIVIHELSKTDIKEFAQHSLIYIGSGNTPFGEATIAWNDNGIYNLEFGEAEDTRNSIRSHWEPTKTEIDNKNAQDQLDTLFSSKSNKLIDLWVKGTEFQLSVWRALLNIPEGQVSHYKDIATHIHNPKAVRAVGTAIGANPIAYLIPCHRVIPKTDNSGKINDVGAYRWGEKIKSKLLSYELGDEAFAKSEVKTDIENTKGEN